MKTIIDNNFWELIGIIIGDGNLWSNRTHWRIEITGDKIKDKKYFYNHLEPLFKRYTQNKIKLFERQRALRLRICSKDLFYFLISSGIKQRKEKLKDLRFLERLNLNQKISVIRGLVDTDGSVYKTRNGNIHVQIATSSKFLAHWIKFALEELNFKPHVNEFSDSRPNRKSIFRVYVYGKSGLKEWLKTIGFSNEYKLNKALKILSYGTVMGQ